MAAATKLSLEDLRARFRIASAPLETSDDVTSRPTSLALDWPDLDAILPDGGLPRGVVELAAPHALGGGTSIALAAVRAAQARDPKSFSAWIDCEGTLYAPGVARRGVDLARLFVVRPPREELSRIAVKVAEARAFDVIVVDMDALAFVVSLRGAKGSPRRGWPKEVLVRKLALLAEESGATVVLLTDARAPRPQPWPVALRLELSRDREAIGVRVAKERYGRMTLAKRVVHLPEAWQ